MGTPKGPRTKIKVLASGITGCYGTWVIEGKGTADFSTDPVGARHIFKGSVASIEGVVGGSCSVRFIEGIPEHEVIIS